MSMGFSRQGNWSGFPFPSPGDLPDPGMEPMPLCLLCWQSGCLVAIWEARFAHSSVCVHPSSVCVHPSSVCAPQQCVFTLAVCVFTPAVCVFTPAVCVHPSSVCVHPSSMCVHPSSVCVHPSSVCVHPSSVCVHPNSHFFPPPVFLWFSKFVFSVCEYVSVL